MDKKPRRKNSVQKSLETMSPNAHPIPLSTAHVSTWRKPTSPTISVNGHVTSSSIPSFPNASIAQKTVKAAEEPIASQRCRLAMTNAVDADALARSGGSKASNGTSSSSNSSTSTRAAAVDPQKKKSLVARAGISKYRTLSGKVLLPTTSTNATNATIVSTGASDHVSRRLLSSSRPNANANATTRSNRDEDDEPINAAFAKGKELLEKRLFPQAMNCFSEVLRLQPLKLKAFIYRGDCHFHMQQYQQAVDDFTQIIDKTPGEAQLFSKRAQAYTKLRKFHEAIADFSLAIDHSATRSNNERRDLLIARARVYEDMNMCNKALEDLATAQELDERCESIYQLRARLYRQCQQYDLAVSELDQVIELQLCHDRSPCENVLQRAELLMKIAENEAQISQQDMKLLALEEGVSRQPSGFNEEVVRKAIRDYSFLLERDPVDTQLLKQRSEAFLAINLLDHAEQDLEAASRLDPEDFDLRMTRAKLLRRVDGHALRAIEQVSQVLDTSGFFVDALLLRARLYEEANLFEKAVEDYTAIVDCEYNGGATSGHRSSSGDNELVVVVHEEASGKRHRFSSNQTNMTSSSSVIRSNVGGGFSGTTGGRVVSEVTLTALMARARVYLHKLKAYEKAIEDYTLIINSSTNMMDAQLELSIAENLLREQASARAQEAADWLLQQEETNASASGPSGVVGNSESAVAGAALAAGTPSSQKKKKKKKKKKKSKSAAAAAAGGTGDVVLHVNEIDNDNVNEKEMGLTRVEETEEMDEEEPATETAKKEKVDEHQDDPVHTDTDTDSANANTSVTANTNMREIEDSIETLVNDEDGDVDEPQPQPSPPVSPPQAKSSSSPEELLYARTPMACTRDEACESMIESVLEDEQATHQTVERAGTRSDSTAPETTGGSSASRASAPKTSPRGILMDEKYLRKRKKQMEKLRSDLKLFCDSNSTKDLTEVLDRIERKNMADQLDTEIQQAKAVLRRLQEGPGPASLPESSEVNRPSSAVTQAPEEPLTGSLTLLSSKFEASTCTTLMTVPQAATAETKRKLSPAEEVDKLVPVDVYERFHGGKNGIHPAIELRIDTGNNNNSNNRPEGPRSREDEATRAAPGSRVLSLYRKPIDYGSALRAKGAAKVDPVEPTNNQPDDPTNPANRNLMRQLQDKDAQIEALRRLLLSGVAAASWDITKLSDIKLSDQEQQQFQSSPSDAQSKQIHSLRRLFSSERFALATSSSVCLRINELLEWIGPTLESEQVRHRVMSYVQFVLEKHFQRHVPIIATGSFPMKTYLPNADIDASILLPPEMEHTWHLAVTQALCLAATHEINGSQMRSPYMKSAPAFGGVSNSPLRPDAIASATNNMLKSCTVRNVSFINAEVRVVKCTIDNVAVDLTANRFGAMGALLLLHEVDRLVGQDHLFKKSLVLIKAWCAYESSVYFPLQALGASQSHSQPTILGASGGSLSTYALNTMVMALFNRHAAVIKHPLQALFLFLDMFADFVWHEYAVSIHGPVPLVTIGSFAKATTTATATDSTGDGPRVGSSESTSLLSPLAVDAIRNKVNKLTASVESASASTGFPFQVRVCNVIDPLNERNNIARSVTPDALPNIRRALVLGRKRLCELLVMASLRVDQPGDQFVDERQFEQMDRCALDEFFTSCWKHYGKGDGWRPDLLVHPRQVWHGSPVATTKGQEREKKWQSYLPELLFE